MRPLPRQGQAEGSQVPARRRPGVAHPRPFAPRQGRTEFPRAPGGARRSSLGLIQGRCAGALAPGYLIAAPSGQRQAGRMKSQRSAVKDSQKRSINLALRLALATTARWCGRSFGGPLRAGGSGACGRPHGLGRAEYLTFGGQPVIDIAARLTAPLFIQLVRPLRDSVLYLRVA